MSDDVTVSDVQQVHADDLEIVWLEDSNICVAPRKPFNDSSPMLLQIQELSRHDVAQLVLNAVADVLHIAINATSDNLSQGVDEAIHVQAACGTDAETTAVHLDYDIATMPPVGAHLVSLRALLVSRINLHQCLAHVLHVVAHARVHVVRPASAVEWASASLRPAVDVVTCMAAMSLLIFSASFRTYTVTFRALKAHVRVHVVRLASAVDWTSASRHPAVDVGTCMAAMSLLILSAGFRTFTATFCALYVLRG